MSLQATAQLLTAALDLQMVRLIRGAINQPQVGAGPRLQLGGSQPTPNPNLRLEGDVGPPVIQRLRCEPEPVDVHRYEITVEPPVPVHEATPSLDALHGPLPAPWQTVMASGLPVETLPPPPIVKFLPRAVDITGSGRMLDQFA